MGHVTFKYRSQWGELQERAYQGKCRRRTVGRLLVFLLVPLAVGCGSGSEVGPGAEREVKRPQPAPVQVARRTPRINAFGYPIYEPVGPPALSAAESTEDLKGRSQGEIEDFLGPPTAITRDGDIRVLRYRGMECSLALFLYLDMEGRLVVAFAKHEWVAPKAANVRSCLLSLAKGRPRRSATYIEP
jgi:hypothetical protein